MSRRRGKQEIEDGRAVARRHRAKLGRQREDDAEVPHRQEALEALVDPTCLREGLAFGAVTIAARVVRRLVMAARRTQVQMPAEDGGPASLDRAERRMLLGARRTATPKRLTVGADDVGELEPAIWGRARARRRSVHGAWPWSSPVSNVSSGLAIDCTPRCSREGTPSCS